nr:antirestriction protein [Escherichia coli]
MQYAKPVTLNVEECDRLSFLPYLFGQDFLYAEASVYALAKQMMPEYEGGFWHFIRLPDGGGYRKGLLRTEIPGGFSPEEAQALLDNLVRSHISKALSGERMAARDRNADLAWIGQQLVDDAWFVRATLEAHGMSVGNESPPAPPETMPDIQTRELVMLIKRLASSLKAVKPDSCVVREAQDWLRDRKLVDITDILR